MIWTFHHGESGQKIDWPLVETKFELQDVLAGMCNGWLILVMASKVALGSSKCSKKGCTGPTVSLVMIFHWGESTNSFNRAKHKVIWKDPPPNTYIVMRTWFWAPSIAGPGTTDLLVPPSSSLHLGVCPPHYNNSSHLLSNAVPIGILLLLFVMCKTCIATVT